MFRYKSKFKKKKVGACNADRIWIWIVKSNVLSVDPSSQVWILFDKGSTLYTRQYTNRPFYTDFDFIKY